MDVSACPLHRRWSLPRWSASQCEVCRRLGKARLCEDCARLYGAPCARCRLCARPTPAGQPACGHCLREPPLWDEAVSAQDYAFPWDRLIADFKFHARIDLAPLLAERLASAVLAAGAVAVDLVVPVPLADSRLVERGFNQAWEVARRLAARLRLEADARLLIRAFETPHQAGLPRAQRESNLRGAFAVLPAGGARVAGRRVALVDDVLTTGATAREATAALRRAGAASVAVWTVARTP